MSQLIDHHFVIEGNEKALEEVQDTRLFGKHRRRAQAVWAADFIWTLQ